MRIQSLKLMNFRPFYGEHKIDLSPAEGNSLVLIHGENQSGKTAFFLALYWCLYGSAKSRLGVNIPIFQRGEEENEYLINRKAVEDGTRSMQIDMLFEHEGKEWQLTRIATCHDDPFGGGEFVTNALLKIDDEPIVSAKIQRILNDVLHHDAAQFYFFDGELLSKYEQWLADPREAQKRVREAIERTVGISALRLGKHIDKVADDFQKDVNAAQRKEKRNQGLLDDRDRKARREFEHEAEIRDYDAEIKELSTEAKRIQQIHGDLTDWNTAMASIQALETQITQEQKKKDTALLEIQRLVRDRYWLPLTEMAREIDTQILTQVEQAFSSPIQLASSSIDSDECALCGQGLDRSSRAHIDQIWKGKEQSALHTAEDVRKAVERMEQARHFIDPSAIIHLDTLESNVAASRIEIDRCETKARMLRREHPVKGDLKKEMDRLEEINKDLGRNEKRRDEAKKDLEGIREEVNSIDSKIAKSGTTDPALSRRSRASALAKAAFKDALQTFATRSRENVQKGATAAFKALVRDEGYDGIEIDDDYLVRPIDSAGKVQTAPSSGGQQLLTLALIAGLNSTAVHDAPIVMDTPFGRLDVGNRERILQWVNTLVGSKDQQVILMVHSGELTHEDLMKWEISPGRSYAITPEQVHQSSITES